ncbi:phosphatase PAP2 family protein [Sphingomonas sp. PR090111-T3T-6A]|uniref:phosphatase PAP2 family protein n=1 Tax=Sphingomonas sp. PR090111-T3T-6A TaxID=685778 RepID=UPI00036BE4B5|nr:phosphatase PAP2 family protein [Sphingomonas sp. PR090111-T3T-6A]
MDFRRLRPVLILAGLLSLGGALLLWNAGADIALHRMMRLDADGPWVRPTLWLTLFGGLKVMGPIALATAGWLGWRRRGRDALWLVLSVGSGRLAVEGIKLLVRRPRPPVTDHLDAVSSWSFPSSHSAGTMMTCLALALLAGGRWPAVGVALAAAGLVGWSRVALGVHWPSDVLAGWGFGLLWIGLWARQGGPMRSG